MSAPITEIINQKSRFLIVGHMRPDGDSIGSALALYHVLRDLGKEALIYNQDPTPENYSFLPAAETIVHELPDLNLFEAAFVLDCGEIDRIGKEGGRLLSLPLLVNIDHHLANGGFTDLTMVDPGASSTGELLYRLFKEMAVPLSPKTAGALYVALLTDTGGFRYGSTGQATLAAAADLVGCGARPQWISENLYENNDKRKMLLLKEVLGSLDLETDPRVGTLEVTRAMLQKTKARYEHADGLVDLPRTVRGVLISVLMTEMPEGKLKVSLRSKGKVNIEPVARSFGGGGHANAASFMVNGEIRVMKELVLRELRNCLEKAAIPDEEASVPERKTAPGAV